MVLQSPKKQTSGFLLAAAPAIESPGLPCDLSGWTFTQEWRTWATDVRKRLLAEMLSHASWFSRPPRRELIEPLFVSWETAAPPSPGTGTAKWSLGGLMMTQAAITPVWTVVEFVPEQETITLVEDEREIHLGDMDADTTAPPMVLRTRDWEARKIMAKERVRETRLKAQIAEHIAAKEEARFVRLYGELDDNESRFSDYDLTDEEEDESDADSPSQL